MRRTFVQAAVMFVVLAVCAATAHAQQASGNSNHTLFVRPDTTVWAWGGNGNGQLGDGSTTRRDLPKEITTLTGVVGVAAGASHSLALKSDGTVWAWGSNNDGQLGDDSTTQRTSPVQVSGLTNVIAIAAGNNFSVALKSDGTVWTWGKNNAAGTALTSWQEGRERWNGQRISSNWDASSNRFGRRDVRTANEREHCVGRRARCDTRLFRPCSRRARE